MMSQLHIAFWSQGTMLKDHMSWHRGVSAGLRGMVTFGFWAARTTRHVQANGDRRGRELHDCPADNKGASEGTAWKESDTARDALPSLLEGKDTEYAMDAAHIARHERNDAASVVDVMDPLWM